MASAQVLVVPLELLPLLAEILHDAHGTGDKAMIFTFAVQDVRATFAAEQINLITADAFLKGAEGILEGCGRFEGAYD